MTAKPLWAKVTIEMTMEDGTVVEQTVHRVDMRHPIESGCLVRVEERDELDVRHIIANGHKPRSAPPQFIMIAVKGQLLHPDPEGHEPFYRSVVHAPQGPAGPLPDRDGPEDPGAPVQRENTAAEPCTPQDDKGGPGAPSPDREG